MQSELSRRMARSRAGHQRTLVRFGSYLIGRERFICKFDYQMEVKRIDVWADTDYAGCRKTCKSPSGGLIKWGNHVLRSWSSTQKVIALSSGEAEYYGLVKGSSVALGLRSLLHDSGVPRDIVTHTDASAALGIAMRRWAKSGISRSTSCGCRIGSAGVISRLSKLRITRTLPTP